MQKFPNVGGAKRSSDMKRALNEMGMYEDGMSPEEMEALLSAVNESKREDSGLQNESPPDVDPFSPERSNSKLTKRTSRDSSSPDLQPNVYSNKNKDRKKSTEDIFNAESVRSPESTENNKTSYALSLSPPQTAAKNVLTPEENHKNLTSRKVQTKLFPTLRNNEKWRLNPLDCKKDDDPPLKARSNGGKAPPIRVIEIDEVPQIPEDIRKFISDHLTKVAREHFINNKDYYEEEIQWGSAIKVGIANGSLDKNPRRERSQTPSTSQETNETGVALRAATIDENKGTSEKSSDVYVFGDDDDGDFESSRKKPRTVKMIDALAQRVPPLRKTRVTRPMPSVSPKSEDEEKNPKHPDWGESSRATPSRKRPLKSRGTPEPQKKRDKSPEFDYLEKGKQPSDLSDYVPNSQLDSSFSEFEATSMYPRRVIPPNPSKLKGRGGGKKQESMKILKNRPELAIERLPGRKKKDPGLTEEEIQKAAEAELITDDEDEEPIFVSETTSKRSERALAILEVAKEQENEEDNRKKEAENVRKAREENDRQERVQKRIREEKARQRAQEALQKRDKEKTERWKQTSGKKTRSSGRRGELEGEQSRQRNSVDWNQRDSGDNEVQVFPDEPRNPVECPVCGKWFSQTEVQDHASNCMDYSEMDGGERDEVEEVVEERPSASVLKCDICENYKTRDGNQLEEHVAKCIETKRRASSSQADVIPIPDSPRTFQPISKLVDSEIDYQSIKHNPRKSSPRGNDSRKRKRFN